MDNLAAAGQAEGHCRLVELVLLGCAELLHIPGPEVEEGEEELGPRGQADGPAADLLSPTKLAFPNRHPHSSPGMRPVFGRSLSRSAWTSAGTGSGRSAARHDIDSVQARKAATNGAASNPGLMMHSGLTGGSVRRGCACLLGYPDRTLSIASRYETNSLH